MKEKNSLKRRIIIGLFLISIVFTSLVMANITSNYTEYAVQDAHANNDGGVTCSSSNHIFYSENVNRWYVIYETDNAVYYSYTDEDDFTAWNNGGIISYSLGGGWVNYMKPPYYFSIYYDENNSLGHYAFSKGFSYGEIYYKNFTLNEDGSFNLGESNKIYDRDGSVSNTIDIYADNNNIFIGFAGNIGEYSSGIFYCDSTDGYNGNWKALYFVPFGIHYKANMLIPVNETGKILQVVGNAMVTNPLRYMLWDIETSENSSSTGTIFTDNNAYQFIGLNSYKIMSFGGSYNETHGCVAYTDESSLDAYAFVFDFETLTKTDEYRYMSNDSSNIDLNADVTMHNNEFFAYCVSAFPSDSSNKSMYITEYHNPSYDSYFNETGAVNVLLNYTYGDWSYTYCGASISQFTDKYDNSLMLYEKGDWAYVAYCGVEGEYIGNGNGNGEEREDPFDWSGVKYWLAIIVFIIIAIFAIYIKKS